MTRVKIRQGVFMISGTRVGFLMLVFLLFCHFPPEPAGAGGHIIPAWREAVRSADQSAVEVSDISGILNLPGHMGREYASPYFVAGQTGGAEDNPFPDYTPKLTTDTVLDYRGALYTRIEKLPPAVPESLPELINLLSEYKRLAAENPGHKVQGNVALGADPVEYNPSDEELLYSEVGKRIEQAVEAASKEMLTTILKKAGITVKEITFDEFTFRHVDVMGSGRFFYSSGPKKNRILLEK